MPYKKPKRRKMRAFKLDEISVVDTPAQEGALAMIMKRKGGNRGEGINLATQLVDYYLSKGQGSFTAAARAEVLKYTKVEKAEPTWPLFAALETSLHSIVGDASLADRDKIRLMKTASGDFLKAAKEELPEIESYLRKGLSEGDMNLSQLRKQMNDLTRRVDSVVPKLEAIAEYVAKQKVTKEFPPKEEEDEGDEEAAASRLRNLLGAEKAGSEEYSMDDFTEKGDDEEEMPFLDEEEEVDKVEDPEVEKPTSQGEEEEPIAAGSATPIGGKRATKRVVIGDDVIMVGKRVIRKSAIGGDLFDLIVAQQAQADSLRKRADDEREARQLVEFTKVAEDELNHLPGTPAQKARILKSLGSTLDKEQRVVLSKMLKAGDAAVSSAFRTVGHRGSNLEKASGDFTKRISEIRARDNCTRLEAMQKARREHPDEFAAYQSN